MAAHSKPLNTDYGRQPRCRLLEIPAELRLMIYDYVATTVTYHNLIFTDEFCTDREKFERNSFRLLNARISGLALLRTCKFINSEAIILHKRVEALSIEPVRMMVDPMRKDESAVVADMERVQEHQRTNCVCKETRTFLMLRPSREQRLHVGGVMQSQDERFLEEASSSVCRPQARHDALHMSDMFDEVRSIVYRPWPNGVPRARFEVEIGYSKIMTSEEQEKLVLKWTWLHFLMYAWINESYPRNITICAVLRFMPANGEITDTVWQTEANVAMDVMDKFDDFNWECESGNWITGDEWEGTWAEGERLLE
ncbi:hypothetical protein GQ44DRAFT_785524 [Phaeosphaeriaceae sp. PMI808]|nr:hypothetical protein GQ44DRAFT_785524 [Phaeosphaeriaceae sp. PMI808]